MKYFLAKLTVFLLLLFFISPLPVYAIPPLPPVEQKYEPPLPPPPEEDKGPAPQDGPPPTPAPPTPTPCIPAPCFFQVTDCCFSMGCLFLGKAQCDARNAKPTDVFSPTTSAMSTNSNAGFPAKRANSSFFSNIIQFIQFLF